jgi:pSer/pThr/pTyr-binding forkhead associated (FHA) protein
VPDPVLTLLKYVFLAVLYLFFLRVLRAVWVELREPKPAPLSPAPPPAPGSVGPGPSEVATARPASGRIGPERLVVTSPPEQKGVEFPLADELTVGRAGGCGVLLGADTFVSQIHARVFRRDGDMYVEDLGSTNGTYLNKKKVTAPVVIRKGDQVQFGRTTMEVRK